MKSESRLKNFFGSSFEDISICTFSCTQIVRIEITRFVEHFGEFNYNLIAGITFNLQSYNPHHVLTHVEYHFTVWGLYELNRLYLFNRLNRNALRSN